MGEIRTDIVINASKEVIWDILTDFAAYPDWNPFIVRIFGQAGPGNRIMFFAKLNVGGAAIPATIMQYDTHKALSWGGTGMPYLDHVFGAEHVFEIDEIAPGQCRFANNETMVGLAAHLAWPLIERSVPVYHAMNQALKERAEARMAT